MWCCTEGLSPVREMHGCYRVGLGRWVPNICQMMFVPLIICVMWYVLRIERDLVMWNSIIIIIIINSSQRISFQGQITRVLIYNKRLSLKPR